MLDDATLLRRFAATRAEDAFAELVRRHIDGVYSAALRRVGGDTHLAEDVTQQVFLALAQKASAVARHPFLTAWLYRATRNEAANAVRGERRRKAREQESTMCDVLSGQQPDADWSRLVPVLDTAIDALSESDRAAVLLRFLDRRAFAEIGRTLGVSEDAARMRVDRALEKLHALLARRGITSTSVALGTALISQTAGAAPTGLAAAVTSTAMAGAVATALSGAGVGSASLYTAAVTFMSTSKVVVGIALLAVLGFGVSFYEASVAKRNAEAVAELRSERATWRTRVAALEGRLQELQRMGTAPAAGVAVSAANQSPSAGSSAPEPTRPAAPEKPVRNPFAKPDYARLEVEKFRAGLALRYAPLYRQLGLDPQQIAQFEATLVEMQQGITDIWSAAASQGVEHDSPTDTSVARMTSDPIKAANAKVTKLLGEEGYRTYQEFNEAEAAQEFVSTLAGKIFNTDVPLTGTQGATLKQILSANTKTVRTRMTDDGDRPLFTLSKVTDWSVVGAQAAGVLTPTQLKTFQALVDQKKIEREMEQIERGDDAEVATRK